MSNDLVTPDDLSGFPGAPFSDEVVDAVAATLRAAAGWHIAPSLTETLKLDSDGGTRLVLPSLHVTAISAVRDTSYTGPSDYADFRWSKAGVVSRCGCWPRGFQSVEVDLTHGYDQCPADLLPAIAAACQSLAVSGNVASQSAGPFSVSYRDAGNAAAVLTADSAVSRYALPSRP